jgi:hypothetical protein
MVNNDQNVKLEIFKALEILERIMLDKRVTKYLFSTLNCR